MKTKFNLVGTTFTHLTGGNKGYSVHGKESKYIEWIQNDSSLDSFYIDEYINQIFNGKKSDGKNYAWLLESKYIKPKVYDMVIDAAEDYISVYDAIFTHNQELLELNEKLNTDKFKWCPAQGFWIKEPKVYEKTKMISMISSNKSMTSGQRTRLNWVEMIGDQIDLYGRGFNEIELKEEGLCDYMFSVVVENGFYNTYFTEKLLDCFATGTIPVYLGSPDIAEYFNPDGIINLSEEFEVSEELYYSKMDAINENLERAKQYEILEDFIYLNYLKEE
jgi:hypothetical protein